jgi:hypothetical protein
MQEGGHRPGDHLAHLVLGEYLEQEIERIMLNHWVGSSLNVHAIDG